MNHRHLLPEEFDLLLDDEVGFGVAPLRDHARECPQCHAQLEDARLVVAALEELSQFAPSYTLANKVMSQVPVFVPWHVSAMEAATQLLPRSRPGRLAVAGLVATVGATLTGGVLWLASHGDLVTLAAEVAGNRLRGAALQGLESGMVALFGPAVIDSLKPGGLFGLGAVAAGFLAAAAASALGLRAIALAARRRA